MTRRSAIERGIVFASALGLYLYTLAPSVNWADAARIQMDVLNGGSTYALLDEARDLPTDGHSFDRLGVTAWDHPLYVMLGHAFTALPLGSPPFRVNLLSALFGALTIVLIYELAALLTRDRWSALLVAIAFAVSHTFWFHSVTSEVYTLHTLLISALIFSVLHWLAHPRWQLLVLGAFISGLGLATHLLFGIAFVVSTVYVSLITLRDCSKGSKTFHRRSGPKLNTLTLSTVLRSLLVLSALLLAFAPWWIQFARMVNLIGIQSTLSLVTTGPTLFKRVMDASFQHVLFNFGEYAVWLTYQFLPLGLLLGAFGSFVMLRTQPRFAFYLAAMFVSYVFFSSNFDEPDRFNFHLPSYAVFALGIACGSAEMKKWLIARGWTGLRTSSVLASMLICSAALPPLLYAITPGALEAAGINEAKLGVQPIGTWKRQTLSYFLTPSKRGDNSAARFGRSTLQNLAPDALVISPGGTEQEAFVVLRYFQTVEGMRPDVRLELMLNGDWKDTPGSVLELVRHQQKCRPIYFTSTNPGSFPPAGAESGFALTPEANLFRLVPSSEVAPDGKCLLTESTWTTQQLRTLIHRVSGWR